MDVERMHAEGMTFTEIAEATGYPRTTVSDWTRNGEPPPKRRTAGAAGGDDRAVAGAHR